MESSTAVMQNQRRFMFFSILLFISIIAFVIYFYFVRAIDGGVTDISFAAGANYDKAKFRLWRPEGAQSIRAVVVLMPGSNQDGRPDVHDPFWQNFARRNNVALVGCYYTIAPNYVKAAQGSGQALLEALQVFSGRFQHLQLENAPLLLWGFSAGGEFNYEFTAWKPERVIAFIVNKGGVYFSTLLPSAARRVPGLLLSGERDSDSRKRTISALFALNRRAGALWAFAEEPNASHEIMRSREIAAIFFESVLPLRLGAPPSAGTLQPLDERSGFLGDPARMTFRPATEKGEGTEATSWLSTDRVARARQALLLRKPIEFE
jgi:hypothetical protein